MLNKKYFDEKNILLSVVEDEAGIGRFHHSLAKNENQ
jgi:hypothetical protein